MPHSQTGEVVSHKLFVFTEKYTYLCTIKYNRLMNIKNMMSCIALLCVMQVWADTPLSPVTVYSRPNGGFVMVDSDDEIIGYSDSGNLSYIPEDMRGVFRDFGRELPVVPQRVPQTIEDALIHAAITDSVAPLLYDISYGQGSPYNNNAPIISGSHCPAGCVAVAMAQIMRYHRHPQSCTGGTVTYQTSVGKTMTADFDAYSPDWDNILTHYEGGGYSAEQAEAVAQLLLYCGVSVQMDYAAGGSGAVSSYVEPALYTYFGYSKEVRQVHESDEGLSNDEWHTIIQNELKAGRPIYMSSQQENGAGHAYVCDGYRRSEGYAIKYSDYHINWGWNGICDGWFRLNKLKPSTNPENFTDLSKNIAIIYPIIPEGNTPVENVTTSADDGAIYDLLGRRVQYTVPGSIYIRGGKKILAQ